jgi:hypothetical protein
MWAAFFIFAFTVGIAFGVAAILLQSEKPSTWRKGRRFAELAERGR